MARDNEPGSIHNPDPILGGNPTSPGALISTPTGNTGDVNGHGTGEPGTGGGGGSVAPVTPAVGINSNDFFQDVHGIYYYRGTDGKWVSTGYGDGGEAIAAQAAATALGLTPDFVTQMLAQAHVNTLQNAKTQTTLGQGSLVGRNPDGTYVVKMPDGTVATKTLQEASAIPGISSFDIAEADKNEVYSRMRGNEARWATSQQQMYTPGQPEYVSPPPISSAPAAPAAASAPMAGATAPAASAYTPPAAAPAATQPAPASSAMAPTQPQQQQGQPMISGMLPMGQQPAPPSYSSGVGGGQQQASGVGGGGTMTGSPGSAMGPAPVGNYGTPGGTNQDYEFGTRGYQDQLDRGNTTYQLGQADYTGNQTRQQYSQRIQDLQNQYNMGQSQFNLTNQGQTQANEANKMQQQTNQNQQMGQSRTIAGQGLGSVQPGHIAGIR